jgi:hypothetical protein
MEIKGGNFQSTNPTHNIGAKGSISSFKPQGLDPFADVFGVSENSGLNVPSKDQVMAAARGTGSSGEIKSAHELFLAQVGGEEMYNHGLPVNSVGSKEIYTLSGTKC